MNNVAEIEHPNDNLPADPMVAMIERVALDPSLPVERLSALMDMRERQMNKEAEQVFNQAFAAAMSEIGDVPKSGENKHLQRRYSTLDDLIRTARPVLSRHGLSLNWQTKNEGENLSVTAIVRHSMGHSISTTLTGPRDKSGSMNLLQGGGSTETYLKRYTGFAILGLSSGDEVDDDGRKANRKTINADQYKELSGLIEETKTDLTKFIQAYGGTPGETLLEEFPADLFPAAKAQLLRKKGNA